MRWGEMQVSGFSAVAVGRRRDLGGAISTAFPVAPVLEVRP